jgi:hypothetical protein
VLISPRPAASPARLHRINSKAEANKVASLFEQLAPRERGFFLRRKIFHGRCAPAALQLFSVALLRLRLLTPRGHDPFGSGHGSEIFLVYPTLSSTAYRAGVFFDVPSEQAQTSLRLT